MRIWIRITALASALILTLALVSGCGGQKENTLQDGCYTAQAADFSHGWKEYVTILVKGGKVVSVEYNAKNPSGFIKSWDNAYMQQMLYVQNTYPNEYTRFYAAQLLESQGAPDYTYDVKTGATSSYNTFSLLADAVIQLAREGGETMVLVDAGT